MAGVSLMLDLHAIYGAGYPISVFPFSLFCFWLRLLEVRLPSQHDISVTNVHVFGGWNSTASWHCL